jgi:hypothetical protein
MRYLQIDPSFPVDDAIHPPTLSGRPKVHLPPPAKLPTPLPVRRWPRQDWYWQSDLGRHHDDISKLSSKKMAVILFYIRILVTARGDHKIDVTFQVGIAVVGALFNWIRKRTGVNFIAGDIKRYI